MASFQMQIFYISCIKQPYIIRSLDKDLTKSADKQLSGMVQKKVTQLARISYFIQARKLQTEVVLRCWYKTEEYVLAKQLMSRLNTLTDKRAL